MTESPPRILRASEAMRRLGVKKTAFYENFILTNRLRKVQISRRAVGYLESHVNSLISELVANEPRKGEPVIGRPRIGRYQRAADDAA